MKLGRIIVSGILIEVSTALLRIIWIGANEIFSGKGPGHEVDRMFIAFYSETLGVALLAFLFGWWATKRNDSKFLLSGILVGSIAVAACIVDYLICQMPLNPIMIALGFIRILFATIGSVVSFIICRKMVRRVLP